MQILKRAIADTIGLTADFVSAVIPKHLLGKQNADQMRRWQSFGGRMSVAHLQKRFFVVFEENSEIEVHGLSTTYVSPRSAEANFSIKAKPRHRSAVAIWLRRTDDHETIWEAIFDLQGERSVILNRYGSAVGGSAQMVRLDDEWVHCFVTCPRAKPTVIRVDIL